MPQPPLLDWIDGAPRAVAFDDGYFARGDGLAESRAVFLEGLGLPGNWAERDRFTVAELGFGTGLNMLALLQLWRDWRPSPDARLHLFSVEAFPLAPADAARALAAWPELAELAARLLARWPRGRIGLHRFDWPDLGATLDLQVGDALSAVRGWAGAADGWMLDGFAPSRNPQMWSAELFAALAARSRPGARAATFTVAGAVRRGLAVAGFTVAKLPGHGAKRERLEAQLPGPVASDPPRPRVAVIGAGVAGAALVRALRRQGLAVTVHAHSPGASHNAAALVGPRLDAGGGGVARLSAEAFARAVALYRDEAPEAVIARGALRLEATARDGPRFDRIAEWEGFDPGDLERLDAAATAMRLDEPCERGALEQARALVIKPAVVLAAWLAGAPAHAGEVAGVHAVSTGWRLIDAAGGVLGEAEAVVLAGGAAGVALLGEAPLRRVRGQVEVAEGVACGPAAAWGGYAIPTRTGVLFGATHRRDDAETLARGPEREANLRTLAAARPGLAARVTGAALQSRAAVRAALPDHLPLAGAVAEHPGLWTLTGLGGRGFTLAPLLAEEVAARIAGAPPPLAADLARLVDPARFAPAGRTGTRRAASRSRTTPTAAPEPS